MVRDRRPQHLRGSRTHRSHQMVCVIDDNTYTSTHKNTHRRTDGRWDSFGYADIYLCVHLCSVLGLTHVCAYVVHVLALRVFISIRVCVFVRMLVCVRVQFSWQIRILGFYFGWCCTLKSNKIHQNNRYFSRYQSVINHCIVVANWYATRSRFTRAYVLWACMCVHWTQSAFLCL